MTWFARQVKSILFHRTLALASQFLGIAVLAVLNPLACLIHCAVMPHAPIRSDHTLSSTFLCSIAPAVDTRTSSSVVPTPAPHKALHMLDASTPLPALSTLPRAVYDVLPLVIVLVTVALVGLGFSVLTKPAHLSSAPYRPPVPPPQVPA